jgi:mono/diheme cytochrome c family protein
MSIQKLKYHLNVLIGLLFIVVFGNVIASTTEAGSTNSTIFLNQGWTPKQRSFFYWAPQGSALLSYDIYLALELPESKMLFNSSEQADKFGLLHDGIDAEFNPDGLPIGVAKSVVASGKYQGEYAGLTCAACHTGQVQYKGRQIRIDGGLANRFDLYSWMSTLSKSLDAALNDPEKFNALYSKIKQRSKTSEQDLKGRLKLDADNVRLQLSNSFVVPFNPGPGRTDAFIQENNTFASVKTGIHENTRPALAPVKPPVLWNTPHSAWVEYSGIQDNPLIRNYSESLGVFGRYSLEQNQEGKISYETTTDIKSILKIESLLRQLAPPQWPQADLGKLDARKVEQGSKYFKQYCQECHATYPYRWSEARKEGKRFIENAMVPIDFIGTDKTHFQSVMFDPKPTMLTRHLAQYFDGRPIVNTGEFFKAFEPTMIEQSLKKAGITSKAELLDANGYTFFGDEPALKPPVNSIKAAPRDGSWSNAPFLHNGSVPNIYELLLPASERSKTFYVGREFDPVKLGIDTSGASGSYLMDTRLVGNSNSGHSFESKPGPGVIGPKLTDAQRYAIIEYLKSIPEVAGRVTPFGGPDKPNIASQDRTWFNFKRPY